MTTKNERVKLTKLNDFVQFSICDSNWYVESKWNGIIYKNTSINRNKSLKLIPHKRTYLWSNKICFQLTTLMKNRILCFLFLYYQFFTSFCKNWQWHFHVQGTSYFFLKFKNKVEKLFFCNPHHIIFLLTHNGSHIQHCQQITAEISCSVCSCTDCQICIQKTQSVSIFIILLNGFKKWVLSKLGIKSKCPMTII